MRKLKFTALVLAFLMLFSALTACGSKDEEGKETNGGTVSSNTEERLPLTVAAEDNGGKDFNILIPTHNTLDYANEVGGTVVSQAVYDVDTKVEEHLGINIIYTQLDGNWANRSTFNNRLLAMAMDAASEYDLIMCETSASYAYALQNGLVADMMTVDALQLDSPWYLDNMLENYGINGKLYGVRSDASLTEYSTLSAVFFNEDLRTEYKLESIYDLVDNNLWTIDAMFEMAKKVGGSSDGSTGDLSSDTFGFIGHCVASRGFLTAFNIEVTEKSSKDGNIYMKDSASESFITMYDHVSSVIANNVSNMVVTVSADSDAGENAFATGRSLFYHGFLSQGDSFRGSSFEWGLAPVPMYSTDTQNRYYTPAGTQAAMQMIMKNASDIQLTGKVMEVKAYYSHYEAVPAYYEQTLGLQYATSARQMDMLEIIRENAVLTYLGAMCSNISPDPYNMFQMDTYWRNDKVAGSISTYYSTNISSWNNQLSKLYKSLS